MQIYCLGRFSLRQIIDEAVAVHYPLEDVYQVALYMLRYSNYWSDSGTKVYRGQRGPWPIVPSIFRCHPSEKELNHRINRIAWFSEALGHKYPQFDEYQRIAIAQHYGVKTWLVDLTLDPWVALFFASKDGQTGDIGTIYCFSQGEWKTLSAGGRNRLGDIQLIKVSDVPRIETQKAIFLNGSHPDLIEQYVGKEIKFRQQDGLIFEDPSRRITKENLLPENDPFATFVVDWETNPPSPTHPLQMRLPKDAIRPLEYADYMEIVRSWIKERRCPVVLTREAYIFLTKVCDFHARLQRERERINITARSLRRLQDAMSDILNSQGQSQLPELREVIYQYLTHATSDEIPIILHVLSEVKSDRGC